MPHTLRAPMQTRGACSEAATFRLLKRTADAIVFSSSGELLVNALSPLVTSPLSRVSSVSSADNRRAAAGTSPGRWRALALTKARARSNASVAKPSQTCDHRTCDTGTIDSAATLEKGTSRTCTLGNAARTIKPDEQVPRMPRGSHVP